MTLMSVLLWLFATIDALRKRLKHLSAIIALISAMTMLGCAAPRAWQTVDVLDTEAACRAAWSQWLGVRERAGLASPWGTADDAVPVLRGNRVLAAGQPSDHAARSAWLMQALDTGMVGLNAEWANLPDAYRVQLPRGLPATLEGCARQWTGQVVDDAAAFSAVWEALRPADDYNGWARVLGGYPLAVPFLRLGIAGWQRAATQALNAEWMPERAVRYQAGAPPTGFARHLLRSAQILPELTLPTDSQLQQLLQRHVPVITVDTRTAADELGTIRVQRDGGPWVDVSQPSLYVQLGSAYLLGAARLQLIYTVWFPERVAESWLDPYAGQFDGLIWRVTLDDNGDALAYDSIHPCGCFHLVFPTVDTAIATETGGERPVIVPLSGGPVASAVQLGLRSGDHQLVHVARHPADNGNLQAGQAMTWRPATELLALQGPDGQSHSLYRSDGLVPGSGRAERLYLWPSGVPNAGAMRVWGRHATAFVGRAHFDDPHLLGTWLKPVIEP